jgi:rubrerythrin
MCKKHHARILDPKRDIHFEEDEYEVDSHQKPAEGEKVKERETAKEKKKCYKVLVVLDGWNHLTPLPDYEDYFDQKGQAFEGFDQIASDDYRNFVSLVDSDTEDDQEDPEAAAAKEEQQRQEEEKRKKEEEDMKPTEWACPLCTFVNSTAIGTCDICGSGKRPPMAELIAAFKK